MSEGMINCHTLFSQVKTWILLGSIILISGELCHAQENIRFQRISVNDGLSQSDIRCMVQDTLGFLWIGTRDGLNRYDGLEFQRYRRETGDSTSLQFNQIWSLVTDSIGNIWMGSAGGISVYSYREDNFQNFFLTDSILKDVDVNDILLTGKNTAILSTGKGLVNFDLEKRKFFIAKEFLQFKGMRVYHTNRTPALGLWVATDQGVFIRGTGQSGWKRLIENRSVNRVHFDPNGSVYLSSSGGLFRYQPRRTNLTQIVTTPVTDILRASNGDLWVASNKVMVLDKNDVMQYTLSHDKFNQYSLSEDRTRVFYQTRRGTIWVGTFGYGLNKFDPDMAKFSFLSEQTSIPLSGNYISAIFTEDDTTILVGTSRGLSVIDLKKRSAQHFSREDDLFQILKIIADKDNNIWLSTSMGLMHYTGGKLINKNKDMRGVYSFAEWDDDSLILATRLDGIYLVDKKTGGAALFVSPKELVDEVACLLVEKDQLWVGCRDGLRRYNKNGLLIDHFKPQSGQQRSLHASFIKSIFRDNEDNLWIGTWGGGLSVLAKGDSSFTTFTVEDGLPNNVVYGALPDDNGILWLSTNLGLSAFNTRDTTFRNFDFFDGLQSNEFNTGAYFKSKNGKMYFGGVNGLTYFNPEEILGSRTAPEVFITSITINGKTMTFEEKDSIRNVSLINTIISNWKANDVGIRFTAVDFGQPNKNNFQYSIKDSIWYDIGNRRSLELIDLASGQHELKIRARKPGSPWTEDEDVAVLTIDIIPSVWQRPWFRITAVLVFLGLIFSIYRFRVARLKSANAMLNKLVDERTSEIQAMNEEIAAQNDQLHELVKELEAFSYSVSHDLRAPLRSVIGYLKILEEDLGKDLDENSRRTLGVVERNALKMNNLINDLLEFSKLNRQELRKTKVDTESLLKTLLSEINTSTPHHATITLKPLPETYVDDKLISQVWINLISNAIKYSAKKEHPMIEIGSFKEQHQTIFYVKDNGVGFDMKYVDKLFGVFQRLHRAEDFAGTGVGLALVQRIVNRHGGRIWAEAKVNEGATFYFSMPDRIDV
jgi:signal transduction histidine kinase/ligand-binding sensor domain-containing protein